MRVKSRSASKSVARSTDGGSLAIERDRVILSSDFGTQTIRPTNDPEVVRPPARATEMASAWARRQIPQHAAMVPPMRGPRLNPRRSPGRSKNDNGLHSDAHAACMCSFCMISALSLVSCAQTLPDPPVEMAPTPAPAAMSQVQTREPVRVSGRITAGTGAGVTFIRQDGERHGHRKSRKLRTTSPATATSR